MNDIGIAKNRQCFINCTGIYPILIKHELITLQVVKKGQ